MNIIEKSSPDAIATITAATTFISTAGNVSSYVREFSSKSLWHDRVQNWVEDAVEVVEKSFQMPVLTLEWVMICVTGDHEDVVLHCGQVGVPPPQQGDQDKHQPLGVEGWPAEEERDHHSNWETRSDQSHLVIELEQSLPSIFMTCLLPRAWALKDGKNILKIGLTTLKTQKDFVFPII